MTDGLTIGAVVANAARGAPDAVAAVVDGTPHTFAEIDAAGDACARRLATAGLGPGQVALVLADTSPELLAQFVGCARAGVIFAPLNPALDADTIATVADRVEAAACLVDGGNRAMADRLSTPAIPVAETASPGRSTTELPTTRRHDGHVAFFTSGTTGGPKAALLSHLTSVLRSHPGSQLEPRGAALCPYPLFHMGGWTIALQQWHARAPVVFVDRTDPTTLADALIDHRIERFNAIPALWTRLAEHVDTDGAFTDLRFADTGTSSTPVELLERISLMAPNASVRVFYGSTEAGNVASLHHDDLIARPGSCGRPGPLTQVAVGADDELLVRGPLLFDGYLGDPSATAAALADGWYHTGDRASVDDDGFLSITGRLGTVIRTGGETVEPEIVERALRGHPAVDDVAVFGVPDDQWGEVVCAAVVSAQALSVDELRAFLAPDGTRPLAGHMHPRHLVLVRSLPRTVATGQIDRRQLRALAAEAR